MCLDSFVYAGFPVNRVLFNGSPLYFHHAKNTVKPRLIWIL